MKVGAAELILKAVTASKERKGISFVALKKELAAQGFDHTAHIKRAVIKLVEKGSLLQVKGTGAGGSFKAAEKPKKVAKKPAAKATKPAAKKPAAKKAKVATPKKATKPAAAAKKTPVKKATKSPKNKTAFRSIRPAQVIVVI
ncbi:hypothetical protein OYC64_020999 [Pagothenia borchgrevinki]|uniref:H15 domain-containing protein n=1 Tax=Pagothenia borchgrevinki TaxID=8213 RepID=A0ABD2FNH8_PAGBO